MKQSTSLLFGLLLTATAAVDAVVIYWLLERPVAMRAAVLYDALCFSQLSLACVWAVLGTQRRVVSGVIVASAVTIAAVTTALLFEFQIGEMVACFGAYALLVILVLWVVKHSQFWPKEKSPAWQFSLTQLLVLMTVVAVLLALFRTSELREIGEAIASDLVMNCALVVALAMIWVKSWNVSTRLAASLAVAGLFGLASWCYDWWRADPLLDVKADDIPMYLASGIIQTVVLSLWMELGQIIPGTMADSPVADGAP